MNARYHWCPDKAEHGVPQHAHHLRTRRSRSCPGAASAWRPPAARTAPWPWRGSWCRPPAPPAPAGRCAHADKDGILLCKKHHKELQSAASCCKVLQIARLLGTGQVCCRSSKEAAEVVFACPPCKVWEVISALTCRALTAIWPSPADCTGCSWLLARLITRPACALPQSWQLPKAQESRPSTSGKEMRDARLPCVPCLGPFQSC